MLVSKCVGSSRVCLFAACVPIFSLSIHKLMAVGCWVCGRWLLDSFQQITARSDNSFQGDQIVTLYPSSVFVFLGLLLVIFCFPSFSCFLQSNRENNNKKIHRGRNAHWKFDWLSEWWIKSTQQKEEATTHTRRVYSKGDWLSFKHPL